MKKHFLWKMEYSLTLMAIFIWILFIIPVSFTSKTAEYISRWNDAYNKIDYMFTAMGAQADSDIARGIKNAESNEVREKLMIQLVKPYLRLQELDRKYKQYYMNGDTVKTGDYYYFGSLYLSDNNKIVGIKDVNNSDMNSPAFLMLVDMNGIKKPNTWGKDIYGVNIYSDGGIRDLGFDKSIDYLKQDCSEKGSGVFCSHFYRIGGGFSE